MKGHKFQWLLSGDYMHYIDASPTIRKSRCCSIWI